MNEEIKNFVKEKLDVSRMEIRKKQIKDLQKKFSRLRKGLHSQRYWACEYMMDRLCELINQGDLLLYCDKKRCEESKGEFKNYRDNSRAIESLRKDIMPLKWYEMKTKDGLYFAYIPELEELKIDEIAITAHKKKGFTKDVVQKRMKEAGYKCEILEIPLEEGGLAADHWYPKEKGGESTEENCVIINKILNEKKNNHKPVEWFCRSLLTNFLNICRRTRMNMDEVKSKLISFIEEF